VPENPYKTPIDQAPLETDGNLKRVWRRFLSGIETLAGRVAAIEDLLPGIAPGPPLARIYINGAVPIGAFPADTWTVIPLAGVVSGNTPVNLSLASSRITYSNPAPNNLLLTASSYFRDLVASPVQLGFRRNGNDSTIVPQDVSTARTEFAASLLGACDVKNEDYIEYVIKCGAAQVNPISTTTLYVQHTGFSSE